MNTGKNFPIMIVTHFHRKRRSNANYSIENIFKNVRESLKNEIQFEVVTCPFESNGFIRRLFNCVYAAFKQKAINHVTGDVHYINLFFKKKKSIITIHDLGLLYKTKGIKNYIAKQLWYKIPVARATIVTTVSEATKQELLKYIKCNPEKIKVIYNPVSPIFKLNIKIFNKEKPIILQIGAAPNKNLLRLIAAVKGLNCILVIIGSLKDNIKNELIDNNIQYENFVDITQEELYEQYKRCDMLFFASTYEGFGMPIIEANAVGRPVITSNLSSMPEVAGDAALFVDPYSIDEIKEGILRILNNDEIRNDLISKGTLNTQRFIINSIAKYYLNEYLISNTNQ